MNTRWLFIYTVLKSLILKTSVFLCNSWDRFFFLWRNLNKVPPPSRKIPEKGNEEGEMNQEGLYFKTVSKLLPAMYFMALTRHFPLFSSAAVTVCLALSSSVCLTLADSCTLGECQMAYVMTMPCKFFWDNTQMNNASVLFTPRLLWNCHLLSNGQLAAWLLSSQLANDSAHSLDLFSSARRTTVSHEVCCQQTPDRYCWQNYKGDG